MPLPDRPCAVPGSAGPVLPGLSQSSVLPLQPQTPQETHTTRTTSGARSKPLRHRQRPPQRQAHAKAGTFHAQPGCSETHLARTRGGHDMVPERIPRPPCTVRSAAHAGQGLGLQRETPAPRRLDEAARRGWWKGREQKRLPLPQGEASHVAAPPCLEPTSAQARVSPA